jgi:hypothetical protein
MRKFLSTFLFLLLLTNCTVPNQTDPTTTTTVTPTESDPPLVSISSPLPSETVSKEILIEGTVSDASEVTSLAVSCGTDNYTGTINSESWSCAVIFENTGSQTIIVIAEDEHGNSSTPVSVTITVDFGTPSIIILSPADNHPTGTSTIAINGTASVSDGSAQIVDLLWKTAILPFTDATHDATSDFINWNIIAPLTEGDNTIDIKAETSLGKESISSINIVYDATAPVITFTNSNNDEVPQNYTITGTVSDLLTEVTSFTVAVDGGMSQSITPDQDGNFSFSVSGAGYGTHTHVFTATDMVNNQSQSTLDLIVAAVPEISVTSHSDNERISETSITLEGTASVDTVDITAIEVNCNGAGFIDTTATLPTSSASWSTSCSLNEGDNTIIVRATTSQAKSTTITLTIIRDTSGPGITITSTQDTSEKGTRAYTLRGTVSDDAGIASVWVNIDGGSYSEATLNGNNWNISYSAVTGTHTNQVYAIDSLSNSSTPVTTDATVENPSWNILVYLDADNDLEPYALEDLNEMESVAALNNYDINIVALVDRIDGYSTEDGDWKGTRLYRLGYDPITTDSNIRSTRLSGMSLSSDGDNEELNMGDPSTLATFIDYVNTNFDADNSMLVFWNHGDGWRSVLNNLPQTRTYSIPDKIESLQGGQIPDDWNKPSFPIIEERDPVKAVCSDDTDGNDILYTAEISATLSTRNVEIIGFDACLMGMLETLYEFKDVADYMIASPETEPGAGWDYAGFLSSFTGSSTFSVLDLYTALIDSYAAEYSSTATTTLAAYDLSTIDSLFSAFESYVANLDANIWNAAHTNIRDRILNSVESYFYPATNGYWHTDVWDLADNVSFNSTLSTALKSAVESTVLYEWHQTSGTNWTGNPDSHGIALYYATFIDSDLNLGLRTDYVSDNVIEFTADSAWPDFLINLFSAMPQSGAWMKQGSNTSIVDEYNGEPGIEVWNIYIESTGQVDFSLNFISTDLDFALYEGSSMLTSGAVYSDTTSESMSYTFTSTGWYQVVIFNYGSMDFYEVTATGSGVR